MDDDDDRDVVARAAREPLIDHDHDNDHDDEDDEEQVAVAVAATARRNVTVTMVFQLFRCWSVSVWVGSILSAYVYLSRPTAPELVGYLSAAKGTAQFAAAVVSGHYADRLRRDSCARVASIVGLAAAATLVAAVSLGRLWVLTTALAIFGVFDGVSFTSSLAVFADSLSAGERGLWFTRRTLATKLGYFLGPACGIAVFLASGNKWSVSSCAVVIAASQVLHLPAFASLWWYEDVLLDEEEKKKEEEKRRREEDARTESVVNDHNDEPIDRTTDDDNDDRCCRRCCRRCRRRCCRPRLSRRRCCRPSSARVVAVSSVVSDIVCSFANGIAFRYFAVFFVKDLRFRPVVVQSLDACATLASALASVSAQRLSVRVGRSPAAVVCRLLGTASLAGMAVLGGNVRARATATTRCLVAVLHVAQTALLNSTDALTRSLVMDHVPSRERARWSSVESINMFGWTGSAAVGGAIVQRCGGDVTPVFWAAAATHLAGTAPLAWLFAYDTRERTDAADDENENENEIPLLA